MWFFLKRKYHISQNMIKYGAICYGTWNLGTWNNPRLPYQLQTALITRLLSTLYGAAHEEFVLASILLSMDGGNYLEDHPMCLWLVKGFLSRKKMGQSTEWGLSNLAKNNPSSSGKYIVGCSWDLTGMTLYTLYVSHLVIKHGLLEIHHGLFDDFP